MHIVHLETGRHIYGGARQVLMLLDGLAAEGLQTTLVCTEGSAIATSAAKDVRVIALPMRGDGDVMFPPRFGAHLEKLRPDVVHVHSRRGADLWGGLAARRAGIPAVLTRRVDNPEPPMLRTLKYRNYERIVAISAAIAEQLQTDRVPREKIRVVHSAIDAKSCKPAWSKAQFQDAFGLQPHEKAVVCVAQLIPRKGHAVLLEAWQQVTAVHADARLLMFGQGREADALQQRIDATGLRSASLMGFRDDVRQFLGCTDLLVHPANKEGLGVALLEAQAAGVPVVAARAGGIPEAVADGESGLLFEAGNAAALAAALIELLGSAEQRQTMAARGPEFVSKEFSTEAMVSGNLAVYKEVLAS